jgi:hypothetical protein
VAYGKELVKIEHFWEHFQLYDRFLLFQKEVGLELLLIIP